MNGEPAGINYMGTVMIIVNEKSFSLKEDFNYTVIKYPKSFQVQVSHEMYNALYTVYTNMEKACS